VSQNVEELLAQAARLEREGVFIKALVLYRHCLRLRLDSPEARSGVERLGAHFG
jgi:hypothetical protein